MDKIIQLGKYFYDTYEPVMQVIDPSDENTKVASEALDYLKEVNANVLGIVMNRLSAKGSGYYYHYYYYRNSYYHESNNVSGGVEHSSNGHGPLGKLRYRLNGRSSKKKKRRQVEETESDE